MGKPCSCTQFRKAVFFTVSLAKISIRYCKSCEKPYQYYKRISIRYCKSCEKPHQYYKRICIRYCKSNALHLNMQWNRRFKSPQYQAIPEKIYSLLPLALLLVLRTCNNTDGNKLVISSTIALYYGDTVPSPSPPLIADSIKKWRFSHEHSMWCNDQKGNFRVSLEFNEWT